MAQSMALASLTATYTDSEGEDEINEDIDNIGSVTVHSNSPDNKSTPISRPVTPIQAKITSKVSRLVSYHDDTIVSDDDGEPDMVNEPETMVIIENEIPHVVEPEIIDEDGIHIPPEPPGHCSVEIQEKILRLHDRMQNEGLDMNMLIQQKKNFRNPSIYEKLIQFCSINELGTNYPPAIYDPLKWSKESYYEELSKVQKTEMEKREKERKTKVEVVSGTKKQEEEAKKRKSKWDQPGGNSLSSHSLKPAGLVQPSLTNSATGTKATVISAFGSLPKKPRPTYLWRDDQNQVSGIDSTSIPRGENVYFCEMATSDFIYLYILPELLQIYRQLNPLIMYDLGLSNLVHYIRCTQ